MMQIEEINIKKHKIVDGQYFVTFDTEYTQNMSNNKQMNKEEIIKLLLKYLTVW